MGFGEHLLRFDQRVSPGAAGQEKGDGSGRFVFSIIVHRRSTMGRNGVVLWSVDLWEPHRVTESVATVTPRH